MNRRSYIAASALMAAGGIAGCLGLPGSQQHDEDPPNGNNADNDPGNGSNEEDAWVPIDDLQGQLEPTVVDFETAPLSAAWSDGGFRTSHRVRVFLDFEATATDETPAIVRATILNPQEFEQTVEARWLHIFDDPIRGRTSDREEAYLVPTPDHPFSHIEPAVERDENGRWRLERRPGTWYPPTITLPAESGMEADYYLLGNSDPDEPPIRPGSYRFGRSSFELAVWADEPGPDRESKFDEAEPPSLPDAEPMAWYHQATTEDRVFLEPSRETVELPDSIELSFHNYDSEQASGNPYYWRLYKLVDEEWHPIEPWMWNQPLMYVDPGDRVDTRLALFHGAPFTVPESREVGFLGGGTYAYETGYALGEESHAALIEVDAPAVDVESKPDISTEVDGETVVATHPSYGEGDHPTTVTVTVTEDVDTIHHALIPEQLYRGPFVPYRTAMAHVSSDVQSVHVKLDRQIERWFYVPGPEEMVFTFGDSTYRATVDEEW